MLMMKAALGLDVGDRRIGVALTETGFLAHRHSVILRRSLPVDLDRIVELVNNTQAQEVVVGVPYSLNGDTGPQAQRTLQFVTALTQRCPVPVRLQDEKYSTKNGMQSMIAAGVSRKTRREQQDAAAAEVILQEYLDSSGSLFSLGA